MEFSIEKAQALLDYIKFNTNEDSTLLDDVTIAMAEERDDEGGFGYLPGEKIVFISTEPLDNPQDINIINYVNKEFGLNLKNIELTRYVHAFLHELGHHMDIGHRTEEEMIEYMEDYMSYDWGIKINTMHNYDKLSNILDDMLENIEKVNDELIPFNNFFGIMDKLVEDYLEIRKERVSIDEDYRRNPAEYAADAFAARIMDVYLRKVIPEMFEPQEHVIRKLDK